MTPREIIYQHTSSPAQGKTLAIVVGGGPAPGINGVIRAATIEAVKNGLRVLGSDRGVSPSVARRYQPCA